VRCRFRRLHGCTRPSASCIQQVSEHAGQSGDGSFRRSARCASTCSPSTFAAMAPALRRFGKPVALLRQPFNPRILQAENPAHAVAVGLFITMWSIAQTRPLRCGTESSPPSRAPSMPQVDGRSRPHVAVAERTLLLLWDAVRFGIATVNSGREQLSGCVQNGRVFCSQAHLDYKNATLTRQVAKMDVPPCILTAFWAIERPRPYQDLPRVPGRHQCVYWTTSGAASG